MVNELFAHITCACGEKFQILNEPGDDWDEVATATIYQEHLATCQE